MIISPAYLSTIIIIFRDFTFRLYDRSYPEEFIPPPKIDPTTFKLNVQSGIFFPYAFWIILWIFLINILVLGKQKKLYSEKYLNEKTCDSKKYLTSFLYIITKRFIKMEILIICRPYPYIVTLTLKLIEIESSDSFRTGEVACASVEISSSESPIKFTLTTTQQVSL